MSVAVFLVSLQQVQDLGAKPRITQADIADYNAKASALVACLGRQKLGRRLCECIFAAYILWRPLRSVIFDLAHCLSACRLVVLIACLHCLGSLCSSVLLQIRLARLTRMSCV